MLVQNILSDDIEVIPQGAGTIILRLKPAPSPDVYTRVQVDALITAALAAFRAGLPVPSVPTTLPPSGNAGGDLSGTYPDPDVVDDSHAHTPGVSIPAYPTGLPPTGAAGGDLSGSYPNPAVIDDSHVHTPGVSIPAYPTGLPPSGAAGGDLSGTYPNPAVLDDSHSHTPGTSIPAYPTTLPPDGAAGGDLTGTYPNPTLGAVIAAGSAGSATAIPVLTYDAKGRLTAVSTATPTISVQDEGVAITARSTLNVVGRGIIADDNSGVSRLRVFDPATMLYEFDDFISGGVGNLQIGKLLWGLGATGSGTTSAWIAAEANHPGILRLGTGGTSGNAKVIVLNSSPSIGQFLTTETFDLLFVVRLNTNDADTTLRVGLSNNDTTNPPTSGIYFEKLNTDTNWFSVCRSASSQTRHDMGVALSTSFFKLRIRRIDSTHIGFTVNAGTEYSETGTIPSTNLCPFIYITQTAAGAAKTVDVDYFDVLLTGMTR